MQRRRRFLAVVLVTLVGSGVGTVGRLEAAKPAGVVLVSVDGLPARYLKDARVRLPTLRQLARTGVVAEGLQTVFPSVTWPSHVSLVTGAVPARHGVIGNSVLDRRTGRKVTYVGDPELTKDQCVHVPTLYDVAHQHGLRTGAVIWPACVGARTLDWVIPDSNRPEIHLQYTTPRLVDELERAGLSIRRLGEWGWRKDYAWIRDKLYAEVAVHLLRRHQLNLLLVHFVTPDAFGHGYGPDSDEARWAASLTDDRIRDIWSALQQPPLAGRYALFVVSDHGFAPYDRQIRPNVVLARNGWVRVDSRGQVVERRAWCHSSGGSAGVYLFDRSDRAAALQTLRKQLARLEGVEAVLGPEQFRRYGLPDPESNPQQPDLMLSARPGYSFSDSLGGEPVVRLDSTRGAHGHLPDRPWMHAVFVAAGAGVRSGVRLGVVSSLDVAPTIARLLGLKDFHADGRVLEEVLE